MRLRDGHRHARAVVPTATLRPGRRGRHMGRVLAAEPTNPGSGTRTMHELRSMRIAGLLLAALPLAVLSSQAGANGLLDQIKEATQTLNQVTQTLNRQQQPAQAAAPQGKNCGALGAGCLDYMDTVTDCLAPLKGYHARMWADVIDERLRSGSGITAAQRANLEEDRAAYRAAEANRTDAVDARISGRMFEDLPRPDQVEVNRRYGTYYNGIMSKCNGADHMGVGHTTDLNYLHR
jgi:hypothetical protein